MKTTTKKRKTKRSFLMEIVFKNDRFLLEIDFKNDRFLMKIVMKKKRSF